MLRTSGLSILRIPHRPESHRAGGIMSAPMEHPIWDEDVEKPLSNGGCAIAFLVALGFLGIVIGIFWWFT
jgi:hypothetical protein